MSTSTLFDTVMIYSFISISYKTNILQNNNYDPISIFMNSINTMMYLLVIQMNLIIAILKEYKYSKKVISIYEQLNNKYVKLRNKLLYFILFKPMQFVMKRAFGNLFDQSILEQIKKMGQLQLQSQAEKNGLDNQINLKDFLNDLQKPSLPAQNIKLNTRQDIDNFLDSLLEEKDKISQFKKAKTS
jgi:hypothetical protein